MPVTAYLDANVFIDFVQGELSLAEPLMDLFAAVEGRAGALVTSELTLAEVLAPTTKGGPLAPHVKRQYLDLISGNPSVELRPVSRQVLYETAEVRRFTRHKLPDAIHCVTAVQAGCSFLMSRDRGMNRVPMGMKYLNSDVAGVRALVEALRG